METKDTLSSYSNSKEQQMQQIQDKAKESSMFLQYTQLEILEFRNTLIQHIESVKKSIDKRALHKREYDSWVNERQMQITKENVDTSKALDASLVDTESIGTESKEQDTRKRVLQPHRNQSVIRQPTAFKSERPRISKPWVVFQVDVNNDLSKPVTTHYLPKGKESTYAKPHHMIAPGSSRYKRRSCSLIPAESDSLPHAHAQTTKTYYKHQDSSIKKAQVFKTRTFANSDIKDNSSEIKLRGRLLASFQDDAKYEHVSQDIRSQGGKDDQDKQGKDL
uniref:Uncharacterized protein n=1 Tax=Tanacetum cinerariifolium TaxID=118510 RepID=A0A699GT54_TANCI|nr:hypothetical protein [Tanacetum cinerariifolium]